MGQPCERLSVNSEWLCSVCEWVGARLAGLIQIHVNMCLLKRLKY